MRFWQHACRIKDTVAIRDGKTGRYFWGLLFVLTVLLCGNSIGLASGSQRSSDSVSSTLGDPAAFRGFWKTFRNSALNAPDQISKLARLPVQIHGVLDSDPKKRCDADDLPLVWPAVLTGSVIVSRKTGGLKKLTVREFLQQHPEFPSEMVRIAGDKRLRIGDFEFVKHHLTWRLALIYTDIESISCPPLE